MFKARVHKFIIIPICTIYEDDEVIREEKVKPKVLYSSGVKSLHSIMKEVEDQISGSYIAKLNTRQENKANSKAPLNQRHTANRRSSKKLQVKSIS